VNTLSVALGADIVGRLERFEDENYRFSFEAAWLEDPFRPVLGQLFEDRRPGAIETSGIPWFSHLLPQGPLRRALAREHAVEVDDDFSLLAGLGTDLPGAVVILPAADQPPFRPGALPTPEASVHPRSRFSLAGVQWKLSVRPDERGLTIPVAGESGSWIAKFHSPQFPALPRVEYATMRWASAAGLRVPAVDLISVQAIAEMPREIDAGEGDVYVIERFDRSASGDRIHMEDFGQILDQPPGERQYRGSHEHIASVLAALSPDDLHEFCDRVVFNVVCGNGDAHLKNWSVVYPDRRSARLSPAYDVVSTVVYPGLDDELALELGGVRRFDAITGRSFDDLARSCRLDIETVRGWIGDAVERILRAWLEHRSSLPFTDLERDRIDAHIRRVQLTRT
jgi:serine/threonine-protein kinase HipA